MQVFVLLAKNKRLLQSAYFMYFWFFPRSKYAEAFTDVNSPTKDNGSALLHLLAYNTGKGSQLDPCWHQNYHVTVYQQQRNARGRW